MTIPTAYQGEALLLRWSETANGRTVTLQLDPHVGEQHPFKSLKCGPNGQRMQIVAVLVGDDEQPVEPMKDKPKKPLTRSQLAAVKLQKEDFMNWLVDTYWTGKEEIGDYDGLLKRVLLIGSKSELDTNPEKAEAFDRLLASFDTRGMTR